MDTVCEPDMGFTLKRVLNENKLVVHQVQVLADRERESTVLAESTNMLVAIQEDQASKWTNSCNN
jgi:hypothetical protein